MAWAAPRPTLAKNARVGHPGHAKFPNKRTMLLREFAPKGGPPANVLLPGDLFMSMPSKSLATVGLAVVAFLLTMPVLTLFTPHFGHQPAHSPLSSKAKMGNKRVLLALLTIAFGLFTFLVPLIRTDPSVRGQSYWSPWDIACGFYNGELPIGNAGLFSSIPIMATAVYALLLVALVCLLLSRSPSALLKVAILGCLTSWFWRGDRRSFELMFYGDFSYHHLALVQRVGFGWLTVLLLGAMGILAYISSDEGLDTYPSSRRLAEARANNWEPPNQDVRDVEFLPPKETHPPFRRLKP